MIIVYILLQIYWFMVLWIYELHLTFESYCTSTNTLSKVPGSTLGLQACWAERNMHCSPHDWAVSMVSRKGMEIGWTDKLCDVGNQGQREDWYGKLKMNIYYKSYKKLKYLQWCQKRHFPCWTAEYVGWDEGSSKIYHCDLHCGWHILLGTVKPSAVTVSIYKKWNICIYRASWYINLWSFFIHVFLFSWEVLVFFGSKMN